MKYGVLFKKGLFLLILLSLINVVSAAHTVDVQLNQIPFYETLNTNFSLVISMTGGPDFLNKINISLPTDYLQIINYQGDSNLKCSSDSYSGFYVINCSNVRFTNNMMINITAKVISSTQNIPIDIYTVDDMGSTIKTTKNLVVDNDETSPILNNSFPTNNTFTNNIFIIHNFSFFIERKIIIFFYFF